MTQEWNSFGADELEKRVRFVCEDRRHGGQPIIRPEHIYGSREALDADRRLARALRNALRPEPLAPATQQRIRDRAARELAGGRRLAARRSRASCAIAAAAALLLGVLWPADEPFQRARPSLELSADDLSAIVAAFYEVGWTSPIDYTSEYVALRVDALQHAVTADGSAGLSWDADQAWDMPARPASPNQSAIDAERSVS